MHARFHEHIAEQLSRRQNLAGCQRALFGGDLQVGGFPHELQSLVRIVAAREAMGPGDFLSVAPLVELTRLG